jgi:two-component system CheB/CheR fusion protein
MQSGDVARHLEEEVTRLKMQFRATLEQHELHLEEHKASLEEQHAMNEELRSSSEELETSREELQSLNEELQTVNQELKIKVEEQAQANDDMRNLVNATEIGTIFLDRSMRIKLFTPAVQSIFRFIPADRGRPLADITSALDYPDLGRDVEQVMETLDRVEREVRTRDGRWLLMRANPYRTGDHRIDGVVLTFVEITERKLAADRVRRSEERLRRATEIDNVGVMFFTADGRITDANDAFLRMSGYTRAELESRTLRWEDVAPPEWKPVSRRALEEFRTTGRTTPHERELVHSSGVRAWVLCAATRLDDDEGVEFTVDITDKKLVEEKLETERMRWEEALQEAHNALELRVEERTEQLGAANRSLDAQLQERRRAEEQIRGLLGRIISVQEDERRRIARDLHDHIGQQIVGLRLKLESLEQTPGADPALAARCDEAQNQIARLDRDLDFFTWELRPAALDDLGLVVALANFLNEWSSTFGVAAEFHSAGLEDQRLAFDVETNLYRIAQEALNNIYKHARATSVSLILERRGSQVALIVEDDGQGFDAGAQARRDKGLGLVGMRERAALSGGTVEIESAPGKGTTVFVRVPLVLAQQPSASALD